MANAEISTGKTGTQQSGIDKELQEIKGLEDMGLLPKGSYNNALAKLPADSVAGVD